MPFSRDSLAVLKDRTYANYMSLYKPLDKTARYNLIRVLANIDAGMYHLLQGDLEFLSKQIFADSAEGEYLRAHWSSRVPPLYAVAAIGTVIVSGVAGVAIPAGIIFQSDSGKRYFIEKASHIGSSGTAVVEVKAQEAGSESNIEADKNLTIVSAIPAGIDSKAVTGETGILGGSNSESDSEYLARVLIALQNPSRYGKRGDFATWAIDATPEVSDAWEFKNFGVFGALLIIVINGNQTSGVYPVENLQAVRDYIDTVSPPVLYAVRTPELVPLNPAIALLPLEDTQGNRELAASRLKLYLQTAANPGITITAGALRVAIIDGMDITSATVKLNDDTTGFISTTILQYPVLGEITWE
ncbi:MAG: hypothetical protein Ta2A_12510 [Treponemataceae bacterium]|nr:MAG: hypothetical protein Ta2A_12510 [Treponemataceae bacterium]